MPAQLFVSLVTLLVVLHVILGAVAYAILLERKIASWVQDRIGPNRVGPYGLLQPLADGLKFILKEDYTPPNVERALFLLAPAIVVIPAIIGWAVVPWGGWYDFPGIAWGGVQLVEAGYVQVAAAPLNIGVIYFLGVGAVAVYGVVLGGYASNNKYSFFGGLRATAQMLSYEIPLGLSVLIIILMWGTFRADYLVELQANSVWNIVYQPLLAIIFFTCGLAETNRAPFDLAEAEQELVGGYHTEYSSMKFALFFMGEYIHMITSAAFLTLLFLGGWDLPGLKEPVIGQEAGLGWVIVKCLVYAFKVFLIICLMMLVRWTLPRFRFDQLMRLAWRALIPLCLLLLVATGVVVWLKLSLWVLLGANVLAALIVLGIGPLIPEGAPVNRRVPLEGSRFSPPTAA